MIHIFKNIKLNTPSTHLFYIYGDITKIQTLDHLDKRHE